jgi:Leucine-rich repeat (LRR) protein
MILNKKDAEKLFSKDCEIFSFLNKHIVKIVDFTFTNFKNIKSLSMSCEKLKNINKNTFAGLENLEKLLLGFCGIEKL